MNADGSGPTRLTNNSARDSRSDWQPLVLDSDGDGIPDDEDVEGVQEAIDDLPGTAFKGAGHAEAMNEILDQVEALVTSGDTQAALKKLENLRRHVDGCGSSADNDDWIVDCAAQAEIRALIDKLVSNLGA